MRIATTEIKQDHASKSMPKIPLMTDFVKAKY